ncbi:GNAT family N-acetyltransferase [Vibrio sp. S9_S30]|uniref:GNAT family N-acetyltransferase n=1 Tax=Vibrio sp. S9_S30 TaxID=2720226 RepID=UPI0016803ABD|nr:GNAT family N-acetyltransferase [Vibrio sp. S9_S30]MBD1556180.1 GNAT family N-acetyltransferase [Vibrio sp. S9_S30]
MIDSSTARCSFIKAQPRDIPNINALIFDSKASWGYSSEQIELWRTGLTITEACFMHRHFYKGVTPDGLLCCVYSFSHSEGKVFELEDCFVSPLFIGLGFGNQIMSDVLTRIMAESAEKLIIVSDPNAVGFYQKYGATQVGVYPSLPEGRQLPILEIVLPQKT